MFKLFDTLESMKTLYRPVASFFPILFSLCAGFITLPTSAQLPQFAIPGINEQLPATPSVQGKSSFAVSINPENDTKSLIVETQLKLPEHWHAYWLNPGTVGLPVEASIAPVKGFKISGPYWSTPIKGKSEIGVFYGYDTPRVAFKLTPETEITTSSNVTTTMSWQMCRDGECLPPDSKSFSITIPEEWRQQKPSNRTSVYVGLDTPSWAQGASYSATKKGHEIKLTIHLKNALPPNSSLYFFSQKGEIMPTAEQLWTQPTKTSYLLTLQRNTNEDTLYPNPSVNEDESPPPLQELLGVLSVGGQGVNINVPITDSANSVKSVTVHSSSSILASTPTSDTSVTMGGLFTIIFGLFIGGIILNLMPCVFPVIGLKILSFVKLGGGERKKVFAHSLAFVIGVILSFWVLTIILIVVKSGLAVEGQAITWAFWMERPYVIFGLIIVMLVMSLSMYGVFEIGVTATSVGSELQNKKGYLGSFWSGILATVIATPCTAPFLSGVMAPALALPSWGMFLAFTSMGLGMAFPYIILGAFPHLVKYLPKPGAWMESFKQGISFILLAATAWLFWVYMVHFDDPMDLFNVMMGLISICIACWIYGRWCPIYQSHQSRLIGGIIALIFFATGIYCGLPPQASPTTSGTNNQTTSLWQTWSPEATQKALLAGQPVYIDFTARWCATCQTNKKIAYTPEVMSLFKKYRVVLLKADKTRPNPDIDAAMNQLGRAAVPLNVLWLPKDPTPHIAREILTPDYLVDFLNGILSQKTK